jgi:hypothetical protein
MDNQGYLIERLVGDESNERERAVRPGAGGAGRA